MFKYLFIYLIFFAVHHGIHAFARTKRIAELKGFNSKPQESNTTLNSVKPNESDAKKATEKTLNLIDDAQFNKLSKDNEKPLSERHRKGAETPSGESDVFKHPVNDITKLSKIYDMDGHTNKENLVRFDRGALNTGDSPSSLKHKSDIKRDTKALKRKISHGSGEHFCPKKVAGPGGNDESVKSVEGAKRDIKPDLDIFFYSNVSPLYKVPPLLLEMYNSKEMTPFEHYYSPYKFLHRRSPIQSALEIANMMVKVGLDDLDSEDYGESGFHSNIDGKGRRSLKLVDQNFCPVHANRNGIESGSQEYGECICGFHQKSIKDDSGLKDDTNKGSQVEKNVVLTKLASEADTVVGKGSCESPKH